MAETDLISRQAAIKAFKDFLSIHDSRGVEYLCSAVTMDGVNKILSDLPSAQPDIDEWCDTCKEYDQDRHCCPRYNRVIREAVKEAKKDDWIPCSERLPEEEGAYLVTGHPKHVSVNVIRVDLIQWDREKWMFVDYGGTYAEYPYQITAWMPLPEPYLERRQE